MLRAVGTGLSVGILLVTAALAVAVVVVPRVTGSVPLTVLTRSMEPTLPPGTLLVVRPTPLADVRVGDVVTYQPVSGDPAVTSHRVVAVTTASDGSRTFTVRGDANAEADPPVLGAQVRGVVWYSVPGVGWASQAVNRERGWLLPTAAVVLIAYGLVQVVTGVVTEVRRRRSGRRRGRRRATDGDPSRRPPA